MYFLLAILQTMVYNTQVPANQTILADAYTPAGVMELVDVVDSKSTDGDIVPVRVRPPAPEKAPERVLFQLYSPCGELYCYAVIFG